MQFYSVYVTSNGRGLFTPEAGGRAVHKHPLPACRAQRQLRLSHWGWQEARCSAAVRLPAVPGRAQVPG